MNPFAALNAQFDQKRLNAFLAQGQSPIGQVHEPARLGTLQLPGESNAMYQARVGKRGRGGTLTSLISEGGAIGGGIAGATIGSAVPVVGTAIGGIIGAGLGAFGGRLAENKVRDDQFHLAEAGKEGALSAVLAGPLKLGKYGISATKGAKAGKGLVGALEGAADDAAKFSLKGTAANAAGKTADKLAIKGFKFTPSQLTKFQKRWGEDASQVIARNGLAAGTADDFTEAIGKQQARFDELVQTAGTIKKADLQKSLTGVYKKLSASAPGDTKALGKKVKGEVDALLEGFGDEISATELNVIRRQYDDLVNYANQVADPARYGVNKRLADGIRKTIQKASGSDELELTGREISKLRQLSESVSMQANRGRGANPLSLSTLLAGGVGVGAAGLPGAVAMGVGAKVANSPMALKAGAAGARGVANRFAGKAAKAAEQPIKGAAAGAVRGQLGEGLAGVLTQSDTANPMSTPMMNNPASSSITDPLSAALSESASANPYPRENLLADIQRDPSNADKYIEYFSMLEEIFNPQAEEDKPLSQGQQDRADLISALDMAEGAVAGGSINYGPIGSRVEGIKGIFNAADPETLSFKNVISGVRAAITKARAGTSLTAGELALLQKYTPSDTDSEQVVRSKLQALRQLYGNSAPTGGMTLQDALMQGGY